jgi:hypothetical protein
MAHYAKIENGIVTKVIVADESFFETFVDSTPGQWLQTSYNTRGNVHYLPNSDDPSGQPPLRGNYAGIGYIYDQDNDVFYPAKPWISWVLNQSTWTWEAPIAYPTDGKIYSWDEPNQQWIESE